MATYTENYGLHQWETGDDFLREDFNEDFLKIDSAIGVVEDGVTANAYNIYNLMLQNYYEGKYTGYKKSLIFDGFLEEDEDMVLSEGTYCFDGMVKVDGVGQTDYTWSTATNSYYANTTQLSTPVFTVTAPGTLTGFTFQLVGTADDYYNSTDKIKCYVNDELIYTRTVFYNTITNRTILASLGTAYSTAVYPGDKVYFQTTTGQNQWYYYGASATELAGTMHFTPIGTDSGTMTTTTAVDGQWDSCRLWVNRIGGQLTSVSLNDTPMTLVGEVASETADGYTSILSEYSGDGGSDSVTLSFALDPDGEAVVLYDYGLFLL